MFWCACELCCKIGEYSIANFHQIICALASGLQFSQVRWLAGIHRWHIFCELLSIIPELYDFWLGRQIEQTSSLILLHLSTADSDVFSTPHLPDTYTPSANSSTGSTYASGALLCYPVWPHRRRRRGRRFVAGCFPWLLWILTVTASGLECLINLTNLNKLLSMSVEDSNPRLSAVADYSRGND